jgi:pimeloyl-ACP methyl ester carboxylesterase
MRTWTRRLAPASWLSLAALLSCATAGGPTASQREEAAARARTLEAFPPASPLPGSRFALVQGYRLHFVDFAPVLAPGARSRGAVLLVHGFGASVFSWRLLAPALAAAGYRVVAVDWPPFGWSDAPADEVSGSPESRARLLWLFLDGLPAAGPNWVTDPGAGPATGSEDNTGPAAGWILIGHSLGGRIAAWMAGLRPLSTRALVLLAPAIYDKAEALKLGHSKLAAGLLGAGLEPLVLDPRRIRSALDRAAGVRTDEAGFEGYWAPLLRPKTRERLLAWLSVAADAGQPPLSGIDAPCLILWGSADRIVKPEGPRLAREIPGSRFVGLPGAGHTPMETEPELVNAAVLAFLAGLR